MRRERVRGARMGRGGVTLLLGATAGVLIVSGILALTVWRGERSPTRRLAEVVGAHRVTRARLTGGFAYAPCDTVTPNDSLVSGLLCERAHPRDWPEAPALSRLAAEMRGRVAKDAAGVASQHAAGVWHVIWGDVDAAIDELRAAAEAAPRDAQVQNDLAAAFLARAERARDPRSILDAYVAADSALSLDNGVVEAQFNRALILEWLSLRSDAIEAWSAYLDADHSSPWSTEARSHLQRLRVVPVPWRAARKSLSMAMSDGRHGTVLEIAKQYPGRFRGEVRRTVLDWARAHQAGARLQADSVLRRAILLAEALARATGDSLWYDAVRPVAAPPLGGRRRDAIARGAIAYERADAYLDQFVLDSAERSFSASERALRSVDNAAQYWAAYGIASVAYFRQSSEDYEHALSVLRELRATAPRSYRVVRGLAARAEGLIRGIQANFDAAIASYSTAIAEGRGTGDPGLELRPHANLAINYAGLGNDRAAWDHLYEALRSAPRYTDAISDVQRIFTRSADLSAARAPRLATLFQREGIRLARQLNATAADSQLTVAALIREAELMSRQGRTASALASIRNARDYVARIESDSIRASAKTDVDLVEGEAWVTSRPDSAIRILTSVADRFRNTHYFRQTARAELGLANAYAATGAMELATRAFESALAEVERRRANVVGREDRARFLDQARPVIDTLVTLLARRADTLGALEFLEQMRGRVLLERVLRTSSPVAPAPGITAVRRSLPKGTTLVSYAVLKGEVMAWVIDRDNVSLYRTPIPTGLATRASRFSELVASRPTFAETEGVAVELYRLLIGPFSEKLDGVSKLIFVPDKWLQFVPFAALVDPGRRQFLVERFETVVSPSLQLYAQSVERYETVRRLSSRSLLAVGNPSFDARVFSLVGLPGAEREARRVASLYSDARLLVGAQATKRAFLSAAARSNVIHFAGHGVARSDAPLLSYLVLASGSGVESAALTGQELFDLELPVTRLAVLSGCQTADGYLSDTEGVSSLARAFFAAGVPAVVASLWAVDDEATVEFFTAFHEALSRGEDPSAALWHTQRSWAKRTGWKNASTWAAFALFGATAADSLEQDEVLGRPKRLQ